MKLLSSETMFHIAISEADLIDIYNTLDYQIMRDEEHNDAHPDQAKIDTSALRNISENINKILCWR